MKVKVIVARDDGQVSQYEGSSCLTVTTPDINTIVEESEPGVVSIRCSNDQELAWNLATILSVVWYNSKQAYVMAHELMNFIVPSNPAHSKRFPYNE